MTWFNDWLATHLRRHAGIGLPAARDNFEMYDAWRMEFARNKINEAAANRASVILASKTSAKANHFPALMKLALKAMELQNRSNATPRAEADATCTYCDGHGSVEVVDSGWEFHWAAFCLCNYGRARLSQAREAFKASEGAILDYGMVLDGRTFRISRCGETKNVTFRQAHTDEEMDYTYLLPPGHLRELADKLRPKGIPRAPDPRETR